ncbi:MAG: DMT family transporter [Lachnospiraceae bacterium]|nr:DMT family transporter [Lachnospiraceae bacterium]
MNSKVKGAILCLMGALCWGISGTMGQYLFQMEKMDSKWLVPIRLEMAGILLFLYCFFKYRKMLFRPFKKPKELVLVLAYGVLGVTFSQFTYFFTIQYSSAGVGTIMQDLSPVLILLITSAIERRRPRFREVATVVLAIMGVFLIVTHGEFANFRVPKIAIISGLLCAVCVSIYNMLTAPLTKKNNYPVLVLQAWAFLIGGFIMGLIFKPWEYDYVPGPMGYVGIVTVVIVGNIMAFSLYISGVCEIGPNMGILYSFAEPLSAAVLSTIIFNEPFTGFDVVGFVMIFIMLFLISGVGIRGKRL